MAKKKKEVSNFDKSCLQYCKDIANFKSLSKEEELKLWHEYKYEHKIDSRNKLINANLKFVMNIAKKYYGKGLSYADLVAEGNLGLLKAIDEKFDDSKNCKIITYSVWWIRQSIIEALKERNGVEHASLPVDTEQQYYSDDDDATSMLCGDSYCEDVEYYGREEDISSSVGILLSSLTNKERYIVTKYYGLNNEEPLTLEEIGDELNITKERVRQIKDNAHKKMRSAALLNSITSDIY